MRDISGGPLVYVALGGAGEIGMNCYMYGHGEGRDRRWIIVDMGIGFGDMETAPGVELVLPDIAFAVAERGRLDGIFLTHGHEDHIGALPHLWSKLKVPVYARPFTAELARRKLSDLGLDAGVVREVELGRRVEAGPFSVEFVNVTHSIPEASMLAIRTSAGLAVHSGDFKLDPAPQVGEASDMAAFEALGDEGVQALACDSTNVFLDGQAGSEGEIVENLTHLIRAAPRAVAATSFASNVARLCTLARAAEAAGRSVVIVGRAMRRMIEVAVQTGQIDNFPKVVPDDQAGSMPAENLFYLVTGSQGEGRAALARIAAGNHPTVSLAAGDLVLFSSKTIPGNEAGIYRLYNLLSERGIKVIDADMARIHVSGHARRGDLARMYAALRPRISVPIHGEHRHLVEHAVSAPGWGAGLSVIAPNGSVVRLDGNAPGVIDEVETGRVYLDGTAQVGAFDGVIRERLKMARLGVVIVSLVTDEAGELIADPEVRCHGAPKDGPNWSAPLAEMLTAEIDTAIEGAPRKAKRTNSGIEEIVQRAVRKVTNRYWGKKPMVSLIIHRLEEE
ncbi:MAG: ribonuclease J [Thermohalobaculum sp.]|nr:ribonuclease J [Thermohalobaculum sp.]